jgi:hypothetical protein
MTADELAQALTSGASAWLVLSIAAILPILWSFAMAMHFARPYIIRMLQSMTLRFGGDVWWLSYVLIRDALLAIVLAMSVIMLMPNLYIGLGLPLTGPLAVVVLLWALVIKLIRDADDDPAAFRLVSVLLVVASVLYIVPQIYGLEAADQVDWLNQFGLGWIPGALTASSGDPPVVNSLAWPILDLSLILFGLTGAALFIRFVLGLGRGASAATTSEAGSQQP